MRGLRRLLERQRAARFEGISGAVVQMTLPLRGEIIKEIVQELHIDATFAIESDNHVEVGFRGPWWLPFSSLRLKVDEHLVIEPSPVLRLRLVAPAALAGGVLGTVASAMGLLPAALRIAGPQIDIDIGRLLRERGFGDLVAMIAAGRVETTPNILTVGLTIRVP